MTPTASKRPDCYDYIRRTYGVPARIGSRVTVDGHAGTIVRSRSQLHHLRIRFDGEKHTSLAHPTWHVAYLDAVAAKDGK